MALLAKALLRALIVLSLWAEQITCGDTSQDPWTLDEFVPLDTIPTHYQITVSPDLYTVTYSGSALINISVTIEKQYLWLNQFNIDINEAVVTSSYSMEEIQIDTTFVYEDFFVIKFKNAIAPGDYQLHFMFNGSIHNGDQPAAEVFVTIVDSNKIERRLMYSVYFFPIFDRDTFKCTFDITIVVTYPTKDYRAISNMNPEKITQDSPKPGMTTVKFAKTPIVRPGSAFFMVQNFDKLPTAYTKQHVAVTLYARTEIILSLQRALDTAVASVDFYADYLSVSFPLPKIDVVVIPEGPNFTLVTAFQQYGMAAFTEKFSIYIPGETDAFYDFFGVSTPAHEMSHESFDESASVYSDTEILVSEGVAAFFEYKTTKFLHPGWDATAFFMIYTYYDYMRDEAELTQRPLALFNPEMGNYASISQPSEYTKGATSFRMLECIMGKTNIQQGFRDYRKKYANRNARATDLWAAMQTYAPAGVNISSLMMSWTCQSGYPLLIVDRTDNTLTISQTRFLLERDAEYNRNDSPDLYLWEVAVTLAASNYQIVNPLWLKLDNRSLTIHLPPDTTWVKVNTQECNYLRVLYSLYDWKLLAIVLQTNMTALNAIDRGDLVDSAFALAESEYIPLPVALDMTLYIDKEDCLLPWYALLENHMDKIAAMLGSTPGYKYFTKYFARKLIQFLDKPIWNFSSDDAPDKRLLQSLLFKYACWFDISKCMRIAKRLFDEWLQCGRKPHADARETVYNTGVSLSGENEWYEVWKVYLSETFSTEKDKLRNALCQSREPWIITQLLSMVQGEEFIKVVRSCSVPPVANMATWEYIRENWGLLTENFKYELVTILKDVTEMYSTNVQLKEVEAFLSEISEDNVRKGDQDDILKEIRKNVAFKEKHVAEVTDWFKKAVQ